MLVDGTLLRFGDALLGHALGGFTLLAQTLSELRCVGPRRHGRGSCCSGTGGRSGWSLLRLTRRCSFRFLRRLLELLGYLRQILVDAQSVSPAALHALRARLGVILIHYPIRFYIASTGLTPRR
jgi:hypothetical protein